MSKRLWFAAKRYGYGWYPNTWEGILITLAYVLLLLIPIWLLPLMNEEDAVIATLMYLSYAIILTIALIWICIKKGEKARWRWGD